MILRTAAASKPLMALSGQFLVFYSVLHLLGVSTFFAGTMNAYAAGLRQLPFLVVLWSSRALFFAAMLLHLSNGILITIKNRRAKPHRAFRTPIRNATIAGRTMIWSGALVALFIVSHLLLIAMHAGAHDLSLAVLDARESLLTMGLHAMGVSALGLHLSHGIQSSAQSLGLVPDGALSLTRNAGRLLAILIAMGYAAVPIAVAIMK